MYKQNQQDNITELNQKKPKNFWQKLKMWQKIGIIILGLILIYIIIIPLLFCQNIDFDFSKNLEYVSCSQNSDCIVESCGCLNKEGAKKFSFWTIFCRVRLKCIIPSFCSCQDRKCVGSYDYGNDIVKEVSLITDKIEYQIGEEVKLTVENNLDEKIEFYNIAVEKFNNEKWEEIRFDIECLGLCEKFQTVINSKNNRDFLWDQKDSIGLQTEEGKFRFRIGVWSNTWDGNGIPPMSNHYSNEFMITEEIRMGNICNTDLDCEWVSCGCLNKDYAKTAVKSIENPEICSITLNINSQLCVCENNKCVDKNSLSYTSGDAKEVIKFLIQQMGDDNISQEVKNEIPEKFYDYGEEAIPYLIEALDDKRVFDACGGVERYLDGGKCSSQITVRDECKFQLWRIIHPRPTHYKYIYDYQVNDWQQWWNENQDKSLNEIRKTVRDYYRAEEKKNNYSGVGYRGEEYDYLDIAGDLKHDDFLSKFEEVCTSFDNLEQIDYLEWSISCGCLTTHKHDCYQYFAKYNKDASVCDKIIWNVGARDNCYWAIAIELNKAGMNDKIDFCDKIEDVYIENHARQKACFELAE